MAFRILHVKDNGVTQGVFDKDLKLAEHLIEVTFEDYVGTPHTVFAHAEGGYKDAQEIAEAWHQRTLTTQPAEKAESEPEPVEQHGGGF